MSCPDFLQVILLSLAMFFSTFALGYAPMRLSLDKQMLNYLSIVGAGLLVGAAIIIIIPEGINVLLSALAKKQAINS